MKEKDVTLLLAVIDTLSSVSVAGYENMVKVIGSINTLREIVQGIAKENTDG